MLDLYLEINWGTIKIDNGFLALSWDQIDELSRLLNSLNLVDPIDTKLIIALCDSRALKA